MNSFIPFFVGFNCVPSSPDEDNSIKERGIPVTFLEPILSRFLFEDPVQLFVSMLDYSDPSYQHAFHLTL